MMRRLAGLFTLFLATLFLGQPTEWVAHASPPELAFTLQYDWWSTTSYAAEASGYRTVSGDFTGDGLDDIAMLHRTNSTTARLYVIPGAVDHFAAHSIWLAFSLEANLLTGRVVAGDFNNDGYDDVAALGNGDLAMVFLSDGSSFERQDWQGGPPGYADHIEGRVVAGDFDGDGWNDDIAALYDDGISERRADVFVSDGDTFTYQEEWWPGAGFSPDLATYRTVAGDVDADGDDDVVVVYRFTDTNTRAHVLRSDGDAFTFEANWWENTNFSADKVTGRVATGDFDGDGDHDLALLHDDTPSGTRTDVLLSTRRAFSDQGTINGWWSDSSYSAEEISGRVVAGDWDGNGVHDVGMIYDADQASASVRADVLIATAPAPEPPTTRQVDGGDPDCNDVDGAPFCTIEAAVDAAHDGDTIQVAGGTYFEEVGVPKYDFPGFNQSLTIQGAGLENTFVDASTDERGFNIIEGGEITLSGLTIQNGHTNASGGGIYINSGGVLTVTNSAVISNTATALGGGIYNLDGSLTLIDSTLAANAADDGGAIFNRDGIVSIHNSILNDNAADFDGGGLFNEGGTVTLNSSLVSTNQSTDDGGGIFNDDGVLNLNGSFVDGNHSTNFGGGIYNANGVLVIDGSTLSDNEGDALGGGIFNLGSGPVTINNSVVSNNSAGAEGGGFSNIDGTVMISRTTFNGNTASLMGGGISSSDGDLTVNASTLSGNLGEQYGGGLRLLNGSLAASNSTFSGNMAVVASGGALFASGDAALIFKNSTVNGNSAGDLGGGIYANSGVTLTLTNTIVTNSTGGGDCAGPGIWNTAGSPNLDSDGTCPSFTLTGDPLLGPLQDNGGPTQTHALFDGSPAIDAGANVACPETDQRGEPRPYDGDGDGAAVCDLGAYEAGDRFIFLPIVRRP